MQLNSAEVNPYIQYHSRLQQTKIYHTMYEVNACPVNVNACLIIRSLPTEVEPNN